MIKNKIKPSKKASYNCEGCLGIRSTLGKITLHETFVILPISSPFIKLANLPKNKPGGEATAIKSPTCNKSNLFLHLFWIRRGPGPIPKDAFYRVSICHFNGLSCYCYTRHPLPKHWTKHRFVCACWFFLCGQFLEEGFCKVYVDLSGVSFLPKESNCNGTAKNVSNCERVCMWRSHEFIQLFKR